MARDDARDRGGKDKKKDYPVVKIISCAGRLSYPALFDPNLNDQKREVWETEFLVPPTKDGNDFLKKLEDALYEVMTEHFGPEDEWPRGRNDYEPRDKIKYLDPEKLPGKGVTKDWSKFTARSYQPVGIVDADRNDVLNKREAYGGRWARLSLAVTVYDDKSKGPTIYLNNVQLLDNDESFGGRPAAEREFDRWDGEELAPGGRDRDRGRDRDDRDRGRGEASSGRERDGGRSDGARPRDDARGSDRPSSREDRSERRSERDREDDRRDSRRGDDRDSGRDDRDADRERDRGDTSRDRGSRRDGRDERDRGSGGRGADDADDSRGSRRGGERERDRDRDRGRDRGDDQNARDDRDRDDRPSRRDRDSRDSDRDWN